MPELSALQDKIRRLEGGWFEKAIRDFCDEHGPSGDCWNISYILDCLRKARSLLSDKGEEK